MGYRDWVREKWRNLAGRIKNPIYMLLVNKTLNDHELASVFEFLSKYTEAGQLDIVSG